jgi:uncharacterized OsmC-like protein
MRAAEEGIALKRLEVNVDSESDDRGILGMDASVPAGPLSTRIRISLAADGTANADTGERLRAIAQEAEARCPVSETLRRAVPTTVEIETS